MTRSISAQIICRTPKRAPSRRIRVGIVDQIPIMQCGLAAALSQADDLEVAFVGDSLTCVRRAIEEPLDILLLDADLKGACQTALGDAFATADRSVKVFLLSHHHDLTAINRAFSSGARGFVARGADLDGLIDAIRRSIKGEGFVAVAPSVGHQEWRRTELVSPRARAGIATLAARESALIEMGDDTSPYARLRRDAQHADPQAFSSLSARLNVRARVGAIIEYFRTTR